MPALQDKPGPLWQTLRSDRSRTGDNCLSSSPRSLTRLLVTFTIMDWIIHLFLQVPLRTVYRRCLNGPPWTWLYSLHRHSSDCRTLSTIWGLRWIYSKAACIRTISFSLVSTGVAYTTLFACPKEKNLGALTPKRRVGKYVLLDKKNDPLFEIYRSSGFVAEVLVHSVFRQEAGCLRCIINSPKNQDIHSKTRKPRTIVSAPTGIRTYSASVSVADSTVVWNSTRERYSQRKENSCLYQKLITGPFARSYSLHYLGSVRALLWRKIRTETAWEQVLGWKREEITGEWR
jgi:hypothetical protein